MNKHKNKYYALRRIERKYEYLIGSLLDNYKDKTMGEFWGALDNLKSQMKEEMRIAGVLDEDNGHNMDTQNACCNERQVAVPVSHRGYRLFKDTDSGA